MIDSPFRTEAPTSMDEASSTDMSQTAGPKITFREGTDGVRSEAADDASAVPGADAMAAESEPAADPSNPFEEDSSPPPDDGAENTEDFGLDLAGLHRCRHAHRRLGLGAQFAENYRAQRQMQLRSDLEQKGKSGSETLPRSARTPCTGRWGEGECQHAAGPIEPGLMNT